MPVIKTDYPVMYQSGQVCPEHPDAGGLKLMCEGKCALCVYENNWNQWPVEAYDAHGPAPNNELTEGRYLGKVCVKHLELKGLRRKTRAQCVQCDRDNDRRRNTRKQLALMEKFLPPSVYVDILAAIPSSLGGRAPKTVESQVYGKVCEKHPELTGLRTKHWLCVQCERDKKMRRRRLEALEGVHRILTTPTLQ